MKRVDRTGTTCLLAFCWAMACGGGGGRDDADAGRDGGPGGDADAVEVAAETGPQDAHAVEALSCPDVAGTAMTLAQKAARFDAQSRAWHLPAGQDLYYGAVLKEDLQTWDRVQMSDNVGMWTGVYAASQAFRYAVTREEEALQNLRRVIRGEWDLVHITGVRGLFTRVYVNPALPGFPTADQLAAWYPDCDLSVRHCKKFVEVTEGDYQGLWFKTDASKDEYTGHVLSMATAWEVVDDPEVRRMVEEIVTAVGDHLVGNSLQLTDIDGQVTTYGHLNALGLDDFPGFNAILALSWMRLAAEVGGQKYRDYYEGCLLQKNGANPCIEAEADDPRPYTDYLDNVGLDLDCMTNWNNHGMAQLSMWALLRMEDDPGLRATYRKALRERLWDADDPRPMRVQQNTLWTFFYLVNRDPGDPWPAQAATEALCVLKEFPESKHHHFTDSMQRYPEVCKERGGDPMTDVVIPIDETAMDNFLWFRNPYEMEEEAETPTLVDSTEDFLLAYWFGRYFGLITPDM